jgi:hypothetical protein
MVTVILGEGYEVTLRVKKDYTYSIRATKRLAHKLITDYLRVFPVIPAACDISAEYAFVDHLAAHFTAAVITSNKPRGVHEYLPGVTY